MPKRAIRMVWMFAVSIAALSLRFDTADGAGQAPLPPFPRNDGFVYPGQPGSQGVAASIDRWNRFNARRRKPGASRWREQIAWMIGDWSVQLRDFTFSSERTGMTLYPPGSAKIALSPEKLWLRIDVREPRRFALRLLAYDPEAKRWVWRDIFSPGVNVEPTFAERWEHGRLRFSPRMIDFHGLRDPDRITLVKQSENRFRIVSEIRVPSGGWVAADDYVFTRKATQR